MLSVAGSCSAFPAPESTAALPARPLRVCLLGYRSNPYSGGQGVYLRHLSKALVDAGHRVDVISGEPYPVLDPRVRLIEMPGLNLFAVENHTTALRREHFRAATDLIEWFSMLTGGFPEPYTFGRRLVRYMRRHHREYDVIHDNQSLCYGLLALRRMGLPVVATIHHPITRDRDIAVANATGWGHRLLVRRWYSFLKMQRKVARGLAHLVTVSSSSRSDIAGAFGVAADAITVVHNGIDTDTFAPLPGIERRACRLMATVSADAPLKGLRYLLLAAAKLLPRFPDLELLVVGKPRTGGETERLVNALGLGASISFVADLDSDEIARHYARTTIAVVPSLYEGFGLPAGEAMACAVPVVSTTGGALPEVVGDAGLLVPSADAGALAAAIETLLLDRERRLQLGVAGRRRMLREFRWERAAARMSNVYLGMLERAIADR